MDCDATHSPPSSAGVKIKRTCKSTLSNVLIDLKSLKTDHILEAQKILSDNKLKLVWEF